MEILEKIAQMYDDGEITRNQAFKAAVFAEDLVKEAGIGGTAAQRILEALAVGGALGATSSLLNNAIDRNDEKKLHQNMQMGYYEMISSKPELRQENEDDVKNVYNTLARFAPSLAADPFAAGTYVKRILEWGPETGADFNTIKILADLEKAHQQAKDLRTGKAKDISKTVISPATAVTTSFYSP